MLPYIILMFAPLAVYQVAILKNDKSSREGWFISIGKEPHILHNSLIVPTFFLLLFLLLACRDKTIGRDLLRYEYYFQSAAHMSFRDITREKTDILYWLLNWAIRRMTDNYQVFLAIIAAFSIIPVAKMYSEDKQYGFLKIVLFMNMSNFVMLFSGLRQSIAIAFGLVAFNYVQKKKPLRFLLFALIALGFHHTAFMVLLYYPLYHLRLRKNHLWFAIPIIGTIFAFNKQIFGWLSNVAASLLGDRYEVEVEETGAFMMLALFALFVIAAYFFPDEKKVDAEMNGLRNMLLMALILQCFAPLNNLSMRMNYYFMVFIPVVIPKIFKHTKENIKDVAMITKGIIVAFFTVYYLYTTYQSCRTGISVLDTYPYLPFWE